MPEVAEQHLRVARRVLSTSANKKEWLRLNAMSRNLSDAQMRQIRLKQEEEEAAIEAIDASLRGGS